MRVVLKPGGFVVLIAAISALGFFSLYNSRRSDIGTARANTGGTAHSNSSSSLATWGGLAGGGERILDGDFSGNYVAARFFGNNTDSTIKAKVTGMIADPWLDNSDWSEASIRYSPEQEAGGNRCQRIDIGEIQSGRAQFVQYLRLRPRTQYSVRVRLRSSESVPATIGFTSLGGKSPDNKDILLTTAWQEYTTTLPANSSENLFVIGTAHPNATIWVDDAVITPVNDLISK